MTSMSPVPRPSRAKDPVLRWLEQKIISAFRRDVAELTARLKAEQEKDHQCRG